MSPPSTLSTSAVSATSSTLSATIAVGSGTSVDLGAGAIGFPSSSVEVRDPCPPRPPRPPLPPFYYPSLALLSRSHHLVLLTDSAADYSHSHWHSYSDFQREIRFEQQFVER
ncbi:hypothetical protein GYMLUDRAFT_41594 [Collybiopsis luxurians FD-317 M1]|uniref:Uncharacterized protein n=1 Tax=Collybiopsis luxurians FD-317 M1 TaxID=944289 RepID=A0A0D0BFL4_9AGAR|nr:hypothetical protein GYMLUDRAFT_41594 [Collybiopsis luxurians FD-317 M1]